MSFDFLSVSARGVVVYQYTRKKFAKIPKIHPNIPEIKESDIPNTRREAAIYRIPDFSSIRVRTMENCRQFVFFLP